MNENDIPQLRRLFESLDAADEAPPPFADELWDELDAAYDEAATTAHAAAPDEIDVVVAFEQPQARRRYSKRTLVAGAVAAGIVLLASVGVWRLPDRDPDRADVTTDPDSPELACARYRAVDPSVADLLAAIAADDLVVENVQAARDALEELRQALETNGGLGVQRALGRYALAAALLSQAEIEVDRGLLAQAERTLASVQDALEVEISVDGFSQAPDTCTTP